MEGAFTTLRLVVGAGGQAVPLFFEAHVSRLKNNIAALGGAFPLTQAAVYAKLAKALEVHSNAAKTPMRLPCAVRLACSVDAPRHINVQVLPAYPVAESLVGHCIYLERTQPELKTFQWGQEARALLSGLQKGSEDYVLVRRINAARCISESVTCNVLAVMEGGKLLAPSTGALPGITLQVLETEWVAQGHAPFARGALALKSFQHPPRVHALLLCGSGKGVRPVRQLNLPRGSAGAGMLVGSNQNLAWSPVVNAAAQGTVAALQRAYARAVTNYCETPAHAVTF